MRCEQTIRENTRRARVPNAWRRAIASSTALLLIAIAPIAAIAQVPRPRSEGLRTSEGPQQPTSKPAQPAQPEGPIADANGEATAEWTPWTGGRYRITPADVIELRFPFVPEFDQTLAVQPDGHVSLREVGDLRVQGRTLPELRQLASVCSVPCQKKYVAYGPMT